MAYPWFLDLDSRLTSSAYYPSLNTESLAWNTVLEITRKIHRGGKLSQLLRPGDEEALPLNGGQNIETSIPGSEAHE